jgi:hypothetical protein
MKRAATMGIVSFGGLAAVLLSGSCSSSGDSQGSLVGTWTVSRAVAGASFADVTLTFQSDHSFMFVEQVTPILSIDAGVRPGSGGCVASQILFGTYSTAKSNGADTLAMTFVSDRANVVTGCEDPALDWRRALGTAPCRSRAPRACDDGST